MCENCTNHQCHMIQCQKFLMELMNVPARWCNYAKVRAQVGGKQLSFPMTQERFLLDPR